MVTVMCSHKSCGFKNTGPTKAEAMPSVMRHINEAHSDYDANCEAAYIVTGEAPAAPVKPAGE